MRNNKISVLIAVLFLIVAQSLFNVGCSTADDVDGEQLERDFFEDIQLQNFEAVEAKIAFGFQSLHQDGARNREEEIALIKGLMLGKVTLTDFIVTRNGDTIVVTYMGSVEETIDGQIVTTQPVPRMSVWIRTESGWQWISHVNMVPLN